MNSNLTNNEEIVLRMLYSNYYTSKDIPGHFWGPREKDNLISLNLVELHTNGLYTLTEKAYDVLKTKQFIVKYPLSTEGGIVLNYNDTLKQFSPKASKALGLAIINTEFYKKWGKHNNLQLLSLLNQTKFYYRSTAHPISRIEQYRDDIIFAKSNYEQALNIEMRKIKDFSLLKPLHLGFNSDKKWVQLVKIINSKTGAFLLDRTENVVKQFSDTDYYLSLNTMHNIIRQYHTAKSNANNS